MDITAKSISLLLAIILTGLSAGLFYGWEFSVIPGTKRIADQAYIETMQAINRAIINPAFILVFLGSLLAQAISLHLCRGTMAFWLILGGLSTYFLGTILVTGLGNVPLNNGLDALNWNGLRLEEMNQHRIRYEIKWNRLHTVRTAFAVVSFVLVLLAAMLPDKQEF